MSPLPVRVDRHHPPHHALEVDVLLAVGGVDTVSPSTATVVLMPRLGQLEAPDLLAGAGLDGVDPAVGVALDQQALAADHGHHRGGLGVEVVGLAAGRRDPEQDAGLLVEGEGAVARRRPGRPSRC